MSRREPQRRAGFTMIEMSMSILIVSILALAFGFIMLQDQRAYATLYEHSLGDLQEDSRAAVVVFEALVRRSTVQRERLDGTVLEVYHFADPETSSRVDRYARFHLTPAQELVVEEGTLDQDGSVLGEPKTIRLARQVRSLAFSVDGAGVQMTLTLSRGSRALTTTAAAHRHNDR